MKNLHNAKYCDDVIRKELKVVKVPIDRFNLETQESLNAFVALLRWPHKRKGELK